MVELNSTIFPFLGPIGTFLNTIKVLVGGVFGVYLIILYVRIREYLLLRKMYREMKADLCAIAEKQKVVLAPVKKSPIKVLGAQFRERMHERKEKKEKQKSSAKKK